MVCLTSSPSTLPLFTSIGSKVRNVVLERYQSKPLLLLEPDPAAPHVSVVAEKLGVQLELSAAHWMSQAAAPKPLNGEGSLKLDEPSSLRDPPPLESGAAVKLVASDEASASEENELLILLQISLKVIRVAPRPGVLPESDGFKSGSGTKRVLVLL